MAAGQYGGSHVPDDDWFFGEDVLQVDGVIVGPVRPDEGKDGHPGSLEGGEAGVANVLLEVLTGGVAADGEGDPPALGGEDASDSDAGPIAAPPNPARPCARA